MQSGASLAANPLTQTASQSTAPPPPYSSQQLPPNFSGNPLPPPQHVSRQFDDTDSTPFIRDPHKLIAYLVPFPTPTHSPTTPPLRFLIYTPPPPPLDKPQEGEKEGHAHKLQRKWQTEVREAKTHPGKATSWKGIKGRATKGINWAVTQVSSADLDFLTRIPDSESRTPSPNRHEDDGVHEGETTDRTVGLEEMVIVYPPSIGLDEPTLRAEFVNTLLRTKDKAQKDAMIASGLLPIAAATDVALTLVWPFGGLLEVDGVWAFSSIKGAKSARSVTKRLTSSTTSGQIDDSTESLKLTFTPSSRAEVMHDYLTVKCVERDGSLFRREKTMPSETEVLEAIGWTPSHEREDKNWEDEQWERDQVVDDLRQVMKKAARGWDKWCKGFVKNPEKAMKK